MKHGSLFSGIGGFDLAAEWMGWENVFHCENNEFCKKILKYYWPGAKSYNDINETDFTEWKGKIDIISGGFPCQPYSSAGKRKGKEDDRHLWPEMLRAIREIQPVWVVGENVFGIVNWSGGLVFDEVQADLEAEGYEVTPFVLPACAKNAPHRRDRVWFIAHSECKRRNGNSYEIKPNKWNDAQYDTGQSGEGGIITNSRLQRQEISEIETAGIKQCDKGDATDPCNQGLQRSKNNGNFGGIGENGNKQFAGLLQPGWQDFPTQSPLCNGDDGISSQLDGITFSKWRNESIKAGGNAVVPQMPFEIFKAIEIVNDSSGKHI